MKTAEPGGLYARRIRAYFQPLQALLERQNQEQTFGW
jgi:hypothetical protein